MKYKGTHVSRGDHGKLFSSNKVYDDRQINAIVQRNNLRLTRPNGSPRYRGSRRLSVLDPKARAVVWRFAAVMDEGGPPVVYPVPVFPV